MGVQRSLLCMGPFRTTEHSGLFSYPNPYYDETSTLFLMKDYAMSLQPRLALLALVLGLLLLAWDRLSQAEEPPAKPADPEAGWKPLFDGKSMTGWKPADFFGAGKTHVKDGVIVMEKGKIMTGVTYTRGDFPKMDYEVALEGKKIAGEDFFCTTTFPVGDTFCSLVVGGWGGPVVGLSSINSMDASMNETRKDMEFKTDRWYGIRIRVSKNRIEAWIDREKMVDQDTTDQKISTRIECNASKPFGIATYETTGAVRAIRVRALSEAEKKASAERKPEKKD